MSDLIERLKGLLIPESPMHPIGCSAWEQEADYVVGAIIDHIEHLEKIIDCRDKSLTEEIALTAKFAALNLQKTQELSRLQSLSDQNRLTGGWRAVPIIPTAEMIEAMRLCTIRNSRPVDPARPFESPFTCAVLASPPLPLPGGEDCSSRDQSPVADAACAPDGAALIPGEEGQS